MSCSYLSRLTFWWLNKWVILGLKRPLEQKDLPGLCDDHKADHVYNRFSKYEQLFGSKSSRGNEETNFSPKQQPDILIALVKCFWLDYLFVALLELAEICVSFSNPILLERFMVFMADESEPFSTGIVYVHSMFACSLIRSLLITHYSREVKCIILKARASIISTIYRKSLLLPEKGETTAVDVIRLISYDVDQATNSIEMINFLWSSPLQVSVALYLLWVRIGSPVFATISVIIVLIYTNAWTAAQSRKGFKDVVQEKTKGIKILTELLNGIKVIKLNAWEQFFGQKLKESKLKEVTLMSSRAFYLALLNISVSCSHFMIFFATFLVYFLGDVSSEVDYNTLFVSLSIISLLKQPLTQFPMLFSYTPLLVISLHRINKFLGTDQRHEETMKDKDKELVKDGGRLEEDEQDALRVESGSFSWESKDFTEDILKDIDLKVKCGKLIAILGEVGSGKSSLLLALLGEMSKSSGRINMKGRVAYVSQQAWLQSETVRKNIFFTRQLDSKKYKQVVKNCCLEMDMKALSEGDSTQVGENGVTLSGGQKQRISLARAVYSEADVYLLDDPLSAVDSHVGKAIIDTVIGPNGVLKKNTRLLVTNKLSLLPEVDEIWFMKDGHIREKGTLVELSTQSDLFREFIASKDTAPPDLKKYFWDMGVVRVDLNRDPEKPLYEKQGKYIQETHPSNGVKPKESVALLDSSGTISKSPLKTKAAIINLLKCIGMGSIALALGCLLTFNGLNITSGLWLKTWSRDGDDPATRNDPALREFRAKVYFGLGVTQMVAGLLAFWGFGLLGVKLSHAFFNLMVDNLLKVPLTFFESTPSGAIINNFAEDLDLVNHGLRCNVHGFVMHSFQLFVTFAIIGIESPLFILLSISLLVVYHFIQMYYIPSAQQVHRLEREAKALIYSFISETMSGLSTIRAYDVSNQFVKKCNQKTDESHSPLLMTYSLSSWVEVRLNILGSLVVYMTALLALSTRGSDSTLVGLSLTYAFEVTVILERMMWTHSKIQTSLVSVGRCFEYTELTPEEIEGGSVKPEEHWPQEGAIEFNSYSASYREGFDLVLRQVSVQIKAKERVAVVGRTGAGKSSLVLALFRMIKCTEGSISIDGLDISGIKRHDLRSRLAVIPQDPHLFSGSLRLNLDPIGSYTDLEIWRALEENNLDKFVSSLERGLSYGVTEGGNNLSVGQKQLICLVRAMLRRAKIVVLDEATASLDPASDALIQSTIRHRLTDCTHITIAHRLESIMDYDKVMVMSRGQLIEYDSPATLLKRSASLFHGMARDAGLV